MPFPMSTVILVSLLVKSMVQSGFRKNRCDFLFYTDLECTGDLPTFMKEEYPQTSQVQKLTLKLCTFTDIPGHSFVGFDAMKWLYITCNKEVPTLTIDEEALQPLKSLKEITIRNNSIRTLPPKLFANLPQLRMLDLSHNLLNDTDDLGFGPRNCTSAVCGPALKRLDLNGNRIGRLPSRTFFILINLTSLDLNDNGLRDIDDEALANLEQLRMLYLRKNKLTHLSSKVLRHVTHLQIIDLEGNPLLSLGEVFVGPSTLKTVLLTNASIDSVGRDFFVKQAEVNILIMDHNCLESIDEEAFVPLKGRPQLEGQSCPDHSDFFQVTGKGSVIFIMLEKVDVDSSGLRYLSMDGSCLVSVPPLGFLNQVEGVSLFQNKIRNITDDDFFNLTRMLLLDVSSNRLVNIDKNAFRHLFCLKILNLADNSIASIHPSTFEDNTELSELYLQHNSLSTIGGLFAKSRRLVTLELSHNNLKFVSFDMFPKNLEELYLSSNFIQCLGYGGPPLVHLRILDHNTISFNPFSEVSSSLVELPIKDDCIVANVTACILCLLGPYIEVDARSNSLTNVQSDSFLIARRNPLWCDCRLENLANALFRQPVVGVVDNATLTCPGQFAKEQSGPQIKISAGFDTDYFLCRMDLTSDDPCMVYENRYQDLGVVVVCSGSNLTSVPTSIPTRANRLFLDGNRLINLTEGAFATMASLTMLYLNGSFVTSIEDGAFQDLANLTILRLEDNNLRFVGSGLLAGLASLEELYLSSNKLQDIDENAFLPAPRLQILHLDDNHLRQFPVWRLNNLTFLWDVRLSGNPWSCDCDYMENYRRFLQKALFMVYDANELFCSYTEGDITAAMSIIAFNASHCYSTTTTILQSRGLLLVVTALVLVVLLTTLGVLLYVYRREIQVLVYSRYGRRNFCCRKKGTVEDADKLFDAFVGYSNDDEAFVAEHLVPGLEKIERPYRLCLHHRDFLVGGFIIDTIMEAVDKSRRSILVLTDSFVRSEWCRFEFKTAHMKMLEDGGHRLILVVLGKIPKNLDGEMKLYLKTNTYLKWGDRLFWEKLYFAMPDRPEGPTRRPGTEFIG